jgi:hypothetical protein
VRTVGRDTDMVLPVEPEIEVDSEVSDRVVSLHSVLESSGWVSEPDVCGA